VSDLESFPPVAARDARVLVLGSMPGDASLRAQRYYAHPRNAFWPIMAEVVGFDVELPYERRLAALKRGGVALWDVLRRCARRGSLDSDIEKGSMQLQDFAAFFAEHRGLRAVLCNGGTSFRLFTRGVACALPVEQLPSTSPAFAAMKFDAKLAAWRAQLARHLG